MGLYERIHETIPNAQPHWAGGPDYDSADIIWQDGYIIVTNDGDGYMIGIYTTEGWQDLGEASAYLLVPADDQATDRVVALIDYLTEYQPEGTDWSAWAAQRIDDDGLHMDDPRGGS